MTFARLLLVSVLLSACSVFAPSNLGPGAAERDQLWRRAHAAMHADSFRIATESFQLLVAEYPRSRHGRESQFYLAALALEPANPEFSADEAVRRLDAYLAVDTAGGRVTRRPEAESLLALARQLTIPCESRTGPLRCDPSTVVETRVVGGDTVVVRDGDAGEAARLRRELAQRDATIRQLREELQRVRDTLAPRP